MQAIRLGDAHVPQVGWNEREYLAHAEAFDERRDPEDRKEQPPVLGRRPCVSKMGSLVGFGRHGREA